MIDAESVTARISLMSLLSADHLTEDVLEDYAMGKFSGPDCVSLEEHLLVCSSCQTGLEAAEEYIRSVRAAIRAEAQQRTRKTLQREGVLTGVT